MEKTCNPFDGLFSELIEIKNLLIQVLQNQAKLVVPNDTLGKREFLNVKEASEMIGLAIPTIYSYTSKRLIPHSRKGKKLYFRYDELIQWLETGRRRTAQELVADYESAPRIKGKRK